MSFSYPVAERALKKWRTANLVHQVSEDGENHFIFRYEGSTCNNGGVPYRALLHAVISGAGESAKVEQAWIEIPEEDRDAAALMCASGGTDAESAAGFFERLAEQADFVGESLEGVISKDVPQNFAGCFCGRPHIAQKWKIALSTMHYALSASRNEP